MPRVAALAIDAAERWLVEQEMAVGRLPHLRALADRSARFRLRAEGPYRSDAAWVRFLTGRSEAALDWGGLLPFDPATYAVHDDGTLEATPFYVRGGHRTIAFDLPGAVVDQHVEGVQITGWGTHSPQWWRASSPAGRLAEIDARFGTNPAFGNEHDIAWHEPTRLDALSAACRTGARRRSDALEWLLESTPGWELALSSVAEVHTMGHLFWFGVDEGHSLHGLAPTTELARARVLETLEEADRAVGRLVAVLPDDVVVVVFALHGMQAADDVAATVLLPELLHRHHLHRRALTDGGADAWQAAGCPPVLLPPGEPWHRHVRNRFHDGPDLLRRAGRLAPPALYRAGRRLSGRPALHEPGELVAATPPEVDLTSVGRWRLDDLDWQVTAWYRRHWPRMPWFAVPTFDDSLLRINLAGREAHGVVPADGYKRACADATAFLRALVDVRTGRPAVAEVTLLRADDPLDPHGPSADLVATWNGTPDALAHPEVGVVGPLPHARTGGHSTNGFAFVAGDGIRPGERGERPAADLTPTLLGLVGSDSTGLDGSPLLGATP